MTLIYNDVDLSTLITKYGYTETPRRIAGKNEDVALNGDIIDDTVAVKYDPSFTMRPLTPAQIATLWGLASLTGFHQLQYTTASGTIKTVQARLIVQGGASKVMETTDRILFDSIVIKFEVK